MLFSENWISGSPLQSFFYRDNGPLQHTRAAGDPSAVISYMLLQGKGDAERSVLLPMAGGTHCHADKPKSADLGIDSHYWVAQDRQFCWALMERSDDWKAILTNSERHRVCGLPRVVEDRGMHSLYGQCKLAFV